MLKRMAITSLAAAALFSTATVVTAPFTPADAQVSITFGSPPPPPRYEVVPAPRTGYIWAPGHYRLVNDQYVWTPGQWLTQRAGYRNDADIWFNPVGFTMKGASPNRSRKRRRTAPRRSPRSRAA